MAIWHLETKIVSRAKGQSVVAAAAYRAGERLQDQRYVVTHDYTRKAVAHREIMLPAGAPERFLDRGTLWNEVEAVERRKDAQLAREIEVALPRELPPEQRLELVRQYVGEQFVARGMIADFAIHEPVASDGEVAPHAHILLTMREVGPDGFGLKRPEWNDRKLHESWREAWEITVNTHLARFGHEARIDRRSYQARGLGLEPSLKEGGAGYQQRRSGLSVPQTALIAENEARRERNRATIEANPGRLVAELTHHASTFTRADVERAIVRHTGRPGGALVDAVMGVSEVRRLGVDLNGDERFSTEAVIDAERRLLASADRLAGLSQEAAQHIDGAAIREEMRHAGRSDEQADAVVHLTRPERIAIVSGVAGAGKTTMLRSAVAAWQGAGLTVQGVALAAQAAAVLREDTGLPSGTVTRLLARLDAGDEQLGPQSVVVLDEAGMLHSGDMARLLEHVERSGAKIVMAGDAEQIQAVQAGAPFRALEARLGAVRLTDARRQRDQGDRAATVTMGAGRTRQGLNHYRTTGRIAASPTRDDMLQNIVNGYLSDARAIGHEQTLLLAHRRRDVRELNDLVREALRQAGEITGGREYTVTDRNASGHARSVRREFGTGDRLLFRQNRRALGVENGSVGTVVATHDEALDVQVGETVKRVNIAEYSHIDHAYARTLHKGQGATAERVHGVLSGSMDRNLSYVLLSRHRESVRAYWNTVDEVSWEKLSERLVRAGGKDMASDYAEARRIAADQFEHESQQEREAARKTRLGAVLHSMRNALGKDRAQQARDAAAQRAREDADRLAAEERLRKQQEKQRQRAIQQHLEDLRQAVPQDLKPLCALIVGRKHEKAVLEYLGSGRENPDGKWLALNHLTDDMGLIQSEWQYSTLRRLAMASISDAPGRRGEAVNCVAYSLTVIARRMNGYDHENGQKHRWEDSPNALHTYLWQAVERHNQENPKNRINLDLLTGEAGERWQREKERRAARRVNYNRGQDFEPGF